VTSLRQLLDLGGARWRGGIRNVFSISLAFFIVSATIAVAEIYPSRPITVVVPFPAGGPTDALARVIADRMKCALNQSVIVENVTGTVL
jgi:tripartite-type tricarboxylate transporter receptor subunit TctC